MAQVTISEAARTVGIARSTIYDHLRRGKLSATRNSAGERRIDTSELSRVYGTVGPTTQPDAANPTSPDVAILQAKIEVLEAQNRLLLDEVQAGREEKNRLLGLLETRLLKAPKDKRRKKSRKKGR